MWTRAATQTQSERLVKAYNDSHENQVELTVIPTDNYQARIAAAAGGKNLPDVFASDVIYAPNYTSQGLYLDMLDLSVLFWNKDLYEKAGLDPETPPTTMKEFAEHAKTIREKIGGKTYGTFFGGSCPGCFVFTFWPSVWAGGGDIMNEDGTESTIDDPNMAATFQIYNDLVKADVVAPGSKTEAGPTWTGVFPKGNVGVMPMPSTTLGLMPPGGHAVRALYLASGAVDLAVETGDGELLQTIIRQWERTIERRTYLTGGMGSRHSDESFGEDDELPPDRAYSETCAGVASVQLAWRLLLATGDVRYADQAERTLFNVVATSPALDGSGFFYANPLHQRVPGEAPDPDAESPRAASSLRAPWFHVSCCPTNVARTLASLAGYVATADGGGVQIHQLMPSTIRSGDVGLRVVTDYPWGDEVVVRVEATPESPWRLSVRVPSWAHEAVLVDRGHRRPVRSGYAVVDATWKPGDEVRLELPLRPRWTHPDPHVDAIRGCVAVERGPLVYCLESTDQPSDVSLAEVCADASNGLADDGVAEALGGAPVVRSGGRRFDGEPTDLTFIPYHAWGNRGL